MTTQKEEPCNRTRLKTEFLQAMELAAQNHWNCSEAIIRQYYAFEAWPQERPELEGARILILTGHFKGCEGVCLGKESLWRNVGCFAQFHVPNPLVGVRQRFPPGGRFLVRSKSELTAKFKANGNESA